MSVKTLYLAVRDLFQNLYFLMFLNGFMIASLFYFKMRSNYENGLFASIKTTIDRQLDGNDTRDSIAIKAMNACNYLMSNRASVFNNPDAPGSQADFFHATSEDLMTTQGACGSYSQVLARILQSYQLPVRIAQMRAGGNYTAHNLVEVKLGDRWVNLDPTYNLAFIRPDGRLASFEDIGYDWPFYSKQVPEKYNPDYRYEGVRYTNWSKVPVLFPAIKGILNLTLGREEADHVSIRILFLRIYDTCFIVAILIFVPLSLFTFQRLIRKNIFPTPNTPFTFQNIVKYTGLQLSGKNNQLYR